jgi:predicted Ser/Thr protein kinase
VGSAQDQPTSSLVDERAIDPSAVPTDLAGRSFSKFDILSELGRGGMGVVFRANQRDLHRAVAIKLVRDGSMAGPDDLARFRAEAEAAATLQHPNIVRVYEIGEIEGRPFLSMEYIDGLSLSQRLAVSPLPGKEAARIVGLVARAIQHAHDQGLLHRDLKPSNILLDREGQPHVTDFGLVKRIQAGEGITRTGTVLGTPSYMAPEQAAGMKGLTTAADIYGLGAVLYELVTGRPPFQAETPVDTLLQVLERDPMPPRLLNPGVDRDLEAVCLKCLRKDAGQRYATATALAEDLARYLAGESVQARNLDIASRLASALDHSHYDVEFRADSRLLFGLAAVMMLAEIAKYWAFHSSRGLVVVSAIEALRFTAVASLLLAMRPAGLRPTSAAERLMWSVWIGYFFTLFAIAIAHWVVAGGWSVTQEVYLYPPIAAVTGMAFFTLGATYWGRCYAIGVAFHALALLMTLKIGWAPLEFGALWALALILIGDRMRRLAASAIQGAPRR